MRRAWANVSSSIFMSGSNLFRDHGCQIRETNDLPDSAALSRKTLLILNSSSGVLQKPPAIASGKGEGHKVSLLGPHPLWSLRRFSCQPWPGSSHISEKPSSL